MPDHLSLWGLLLPIRRTFYECVNLRPARLLRGVNSPLAKPNYLDITVVRESTLTQAGVHRYAVFDLAHTEAAGPLTRQSALTMLPHGYCK